MMKLLAVAPPFKMTLVRRERKAVIDSVKDLITLHEVTTKLELSLPSFLCGVKDKIERAATGYLVGLFSNSLKKVGGMKI